MRYNQALWVVLLSLCLIFGAYAGEMKVKDFCGINGVSFFHLHSDPHRWQIARNRIKAADWLRVKWHRCDFWWSKIEPQKGQLQFSYSDKAVNMLVSNERRLMPILCYNPAWQLIPRLQPMKNRNYMQDMSMLWSIATKEKLKTGKSGMNRISLRSGCLAPILNITPTS
ncbi:hypothetical protein J7M23_00890 [Candidatus Sumerlaeota bacterium]|nr:hypothetical protein [Candidatus Sumerlaeota bacterium]